MDISLHDKVKKETKVRCPPEYQGCQDAIGDQKTDQYSVIYGRQNTWFRTFIEYLHDPVDALAQIYTCLRVVDAPASVPFSLATLHLVDSTMSSLTYKFSSLMDEIDGIAKSINNVRQLYYLLDVPNLIVSGTVPFPENAMDVKQGISIEFRNVSFSYSNKGSYGSPSTKRTFALKNVSFKIEQGQLCVSVQRLLFDWAVTDSNTHRSSLERTGLEKARSLPSSIASTMSQRAKFC